MGQEQEGKPPDGMPPDPFGGTGHFQCDYRRVQAPSIYFVFNLLRIQKEHPGPIGTQLFCRFILQMQNAPGQGIAGVFWAMFSLYFMNGQSNSMRHNQVRFPWQISVILGCAAAWLMAFAPTTQATQDTFPQRNYNFQAFRLEGGELAYQGRYSNTRQGSFIKETHLYYTPKGQLIYQADALIEPATSLVVTLTSEMIPTNQVTDVRRIGTAFQITTRDRTTRKVLTDIHQDDEPGLLFWPNLLPWVQGRLPDFEKAPVLSFRLYDLESNSVYPVRLKRANGDAPWVPGTPLQLHMELDLFFLGSLLPDSLLIFTQGSMEGPFEYRGRTVLPDANGGHEYLRIVFTPAVSKPLAGLPAHIRAN